MNALIAKIHVHRFILTNFWVILISCVSLNQLHAQNEGEKAFKEGEELRKTNQCEEAIILYKAAIRKADHHMYYYQKGKCEYRLGREDSARASYKAAIKIDPSFTPAYALLAKIYKDERDFENAAYYYEQAANYETDRERKIQYMLLLVNLLLRENQIDRAKTLLTKAESIDDKDAYVLYYHAEIRSIEGQWEEARDYYERALTLDRVKNASQEEQAKFFYGLGLAYKQLGDEMKAEATWEKVSGGPYRQLVDEYLAEKDSPLKFFKIAMSYYVNEEYDESLAYLSKTLERKADFGRAYDLRARIYRKLYDLRRALDQYEQAVKWESDPEKRGKLYVSMAQISEKQQEYTASLEYLYKAEESGLKFSESLFFFKAQMEYRSARYKDATQSLKRLIQNTTKSTSRAKYYYLLGKTASKEKNMVLAQEAFSKAMYGPYKPAAEVELAKLTNIE